MARLILLIIGTLFAGLWIYLYCKNSKKYLEVCQSIKGKEYTLPEIYFIGFGFMDLLHYTRNTPYDRKMIKQMAEVYGDRYSQYYYFVLRGGQFTYGLTLVPVGLMLAGMIGKPVLGILGIAFAGIMIFDLEDNFRKKLKRRKEALLSDFPVVLSKLALLVNSGMVMREAWKKVAYGGTTPLYIEMQKTVSDLENGAIEVEAYRQFGNRCDIREIRKFASTMIQNLQKGSFELVGFLEEMSAEMWELKKHDVKRRGDSATQKLMAPVFLIFIGVLAMTMIPMLANMTMSF